jgi:hypothetical protein
MDHLKSRVLSVSAFGLLAGAATQASAAVIISIGSVTALPGTTALVPVHATSTAFDEISGYNFPLDFNLDNYNANLPSGFSLNAQPFQNSLLGTVAFNQAVDLNTAIGTDGIANTSTQVNVALGLTPTLLFNLAIDVSPTATVGSSLPLQIEAPGAPFAQQFRVAGPNSPTVLAPTEGLPVLGGVAVIPEPASIALAALGLIAFGKRRRA